MKRCVIATNKPWQWIDDFQNYSVMIVNPNSTKSRIKYLLDKSDYSVLVTDTQIQYRPGGDYANEKVFWYTSGTTGDSKFYSFTEEQINEMAKTICDSYNINLNDRYFGVMPLWHAHGQGFYWATKLAKCEVKFGTIADKIQIEQFKPTFFTSIPDMSSAVVRMQLKNLRFYRTASAPLRNNTYKQLSDRFQCPIVEAFGMTETLSHCFTNPLDGPQRQGTVGLPDNIEAKIDSEQHLWLRSSRAYTDQWFDTGDLATQDEFGYYQILGRHVDQLNIRGIKINPASLELQLTSKFPKILQVVCFGEENLKCLYVGEVEKKEIQTFLISLGTFLRPKLLLKVDEIPTDGTKVSRKFLSTKF